MSFNFTEIREFLRFKDGKIYIKILTASGRDGSSFVIISPTLLVSGYGADEVEAKTSFEHNIALFCKDFIELTASQRIAYLQKLGFVKEKYKRKNFSKVYVDENGVLQGLEPGTLITSILEATV